MILKDNKSNSPKTATSNNKLFHKKELFVSLIDLQDGAFEKKRSRFPLPELIFHWFQDKTSTYIFFYQLTQNSMKI